MVIYRGKGPAIKAVAKRFKMSVNDSRKLYTRLYKTAHIDNSEYECTAELRARGAETMMKILAYDTNQVIEMEDKND